MSALSSIRFVVNNRALYAVWSKPIPALVHWSFLAFVVALALEGWPLEADVTLTKLLGVIFFACYLTQSGLPIRVSLPPIPAAMWWFLMYFLLYAFAALSYLDGGIRAYVLQLFRFVQFFVLFWFASDLLRDPGFTKKTLLTYAITCAALAIGALAGVPGLAADGGSARDLTVLETNPNTLAIQMACAAVIIMGYCIQEATWSAKRKALLLIMTLPVFVVMVQTGSRSGIGAFVIGMAVFFFPHRGSKKQKLAFFLAAAAIAGVIYLLLSDPQAAERITRTIQEGESAGRDAIYSAALNMFNERPLFGWGAREAFQELGWRLGLAGSRDAHNFILYLLIEVGLVGTIPFLLGVGLCALRAFKSRTGQLGLIPLSLLLTVLIYNLGHTAIALKAFWLILGLAVAASAAGRESKYRRVRAIKAERPGKLDRIRAPQSLPTAIDSR
jgi:O-antigen ligase